MTIQESAQYLTYLAAAMGYIEAGCSVIPVNGKKPAVQWAKYQITRTPYSHVHEWYKSGKLSGVGIVCGQVSNNLVVIDLDGNEAVQTFRETFPVLAMKNRRLWIEQALNVHTLQFTRLISK